MYFYAKHEFVAQVYDYHNFEKYENKEIKTTIWEI